MDYAHDNTGIGEDDLDCIFRYSPRESTVIEMLGGERYIPAISTLESSHDVEADDWREWLQKLKKRTAKTLIRQSGESGLVLILARRAGEPATGKLRRASVADWLESINQPLPCPTNTRQKTTLSEKALKALASLSGSTLMPVAEPICPTRRGVRTLPFSKDSFRVITGQFETHGSIAKAISRSDVPLCSCEQVEMGEPAYVFNCRTSNAWEDDLALSATHFPERRLTLAIVYGASIATEKEIISRLNLVGQGVIHPILLPGIFIELERARHSKLVKDMGVMLESKILEFQVSIDDLKGRIDMEDKYRRNRDKRAAWLDTVYLKNSLLTWKTQIRKMIETIQDLEDGGSRVSSRVSQGRVDTDETLVDDNQSEGDDTRETPSQNRDAPQSTCEVNMTPEIDTGKEDNHILSLKERKEIQEGFEPTVKVTGRRIKTRLEAIKDEYEDWVRDCSMRVDGMAMATQWASGETNVEIALSTRRDSKYMRSIAILTMIFLPGTWLAGVFSMTFFDWKTESGDPFVSHYLWIYIVVTVILTGLTVGCWYYVTVYRPKHVNRAEDADDEEAIC